MWRRERENGGVRHCGIAFRIAALFLTVACTAYGQVSGGPARVSTGNTVEYCLDCHQEATLGQTRPPEQGKALIVNPEGYAASAHAAKSCTFCHYGFNDFPHAEKALARSKPKCVSCHRGEQFADWAFDLVREEFEGSIHATKLGDKISCASCHNPHLFKPSRTTSSIRETVVASNAICQSCHQDPAGIEAKFSVTIRPLEQIHGFLPNRELHWRAVRCLDCHTPVNMRMVSHKILPKEAAVRNCVECHSQESRLLSKLYLHRVQEEREQAGFLNSVVLNDAYLVGMTRNKYLDWLSIGMAMLTALGIVLHALGRYLAGRKERGQ